MEQKTILELFDPKNAKNLTVVEIEVMAGLNMQQVKELAQAFPNSPSGTAYLVLKDKSKADNKQTYPLSTWANYFALLKAGQKQFVPHSFTAIFDVKKKPLKVAPVQDMSKEQVAAELKTSGKQEAAKVNEEKNTGLKVAEEQAVTEEKVDAPAVDENTSSEKTVVEKPLAKMNKAELTEKYTAVFGEAPADGLSNAVLMNSIKEKLGS